MILTWGNFQYPIVFFPRGDGWSATAHSQYADEISRAPDDVLSFMDAVADVWSILCSPSATDYDV